MKIGIMSMQRIKNYGSFWQAFGLKKMIEELGNDVIFVDYHVGEPVEKINLDTVNIISKKDKIRKKIIGGIFEFKYRFIWLPKYLNVSLKKQYGDNIDKLVIGSDEVFNCTQSGKKVGYSKELFGYGKKNVITYAASFGFTTHDRLKKYNIDKEVGKMLKKIKSISVRDQNSYDIVTELTGTSPMIHLDPVLVSNVNKINIPKVNLKDYIIIYSYSGRITDDEKKEIIEFAKLKNKKIISLGIYNSFADKNIVASPFKVLSYFKNADYIITDTFHGSIFSIIFEKKFVTLVRDTNRQKLSDLLNRLGLKNRTLEKIKKLNEKIDEPINYSSVNKIIENERNKSIEYLKDNLQRVK